MWNSNFGAREHLGRSFLARDVEHLGDTIHRDFDTVVREPCPANWTVLLQRLAASEAAARADDDASEGASRDAE